MSNRSISPESPIDNKFEYRPASPDDAKAMVLVVDRAVAARKGNPIPVEVLDMEVVRRTSELLSQAATWSNLAFDNDKLIGLVMGYPASNPKTDELIPNKEHLSLLFIDPDYWSKGIGGYLLDWSADTLKARGVKSIELWTESDNERARPLYERKGYYLTGQDRIHPNYHEHQVEYQLDLE